MVSRCYISRGLSGRFQFVQPGQIRKEHSWENQRATTEERRKNVLRV